MADHVKETPNKGITDPDTRKWIYGVVAALLAVGVGYNLVKAEDVPLWLNLVGSVLGVATASLAGANTPR